MILLLDINDDKAAFILELLENFTFVKSTPLTPYEAQVLKSLTDAVEEVNEIKAGKKYSQSLSSFLDDL